MPAKSHHRGPGGLTRTHSRTSSASSSKVNVNLQLTQKEPAPSRYADKQTKRNSHLYHEVVIQLLFFVQLLGQLASSSPYLTLWLIAVFLFWTQGTSRTTSPIPRNHSHLSHTRSKSREHLANNHRAVAPLSNANKPAGSKHKVGFTISSPSENDDDEWVSSESGAATPLQDPNAEQEPPADETRPNLQRSTSRVSGFAPDEQPTPRARTPPLPPVETPPAPSHPPHRRDYASHNAPHHTPSPVPEEGPLPEYRRQQSRTASPPQVPAQIPRARSETHSPPRRSPDPTSHRHSLTRPPSTHSVASRTESLRPHPLIRANSYGHGILNPGKPAALAPLATVSSDTASAQMSTSSSPTSLRTASPVLSKASSMSPILSHASPTTSEASRQLRRTSTSSARSIATMPVGPSPSQVQLNKSNHDRQRTLSSSSTFAALSSFGLRSAGTTPSPPPRAPIQHFVVTFPSHDEQAQQDVHQLLPPPYLSSHLSLLAYRNPLAESYERIRRAKQAL
ncbi:hypothetical protein K474DRAFT_1774787 [Panus rudis PR-1116 ss-1]|nr:hypothetical protein K474DRAFT_1774787 [Panus rudis PR-1116 ss-1]